MGKTLYFDCFSGASGDMILGALLDAGVPLEALRGALGSLAIEHGVLSTERVLRSGISATKFRLIEPAHAAAPGDSARGASVDSGRLTRTPTAIGSATAVCTVTVTTRPGCTRPPSPACPP